MKKFSAFFLLVLALAQLACNKESDAASPNSTGKGGSLARFTIVGNYLYLADYNSIEVFDISNPAVTEKKGSVNVGFGVETIFPYKDKLFIGSVDGMYIYDLADPKLPKKLGEARHVRSCDPVVANDSVAYVTLRGSGNCGAATDGLYTYNLSNLTAPVQKSLLPLSNPYGLGLKDTVVFVCRGGQTGCRWSMSKTPHRQSCYIHSRKALTSMSFHTTTCSSVMSVPVFCFTIPGMSINW